MTEKATRQLLQSPTSPDPGPSSDVRLSSASGRVDGRSLRKTGRTEQFATRVTPQWNAKLRAVAQREGATLAEILEKALDAYDSK